MAYNIGRLDQIAGDLERLQHAASMRRHLNTYILLVAVLIVTALGFFSGVAQQNGARGQAPGVNSLTQNFLAHSDVGVRPSVEPSFLHADEIIGWQPVTKTVPLLQ